MIYLCIDNFTDFKKDNYYKFNLFIYNKKIEYFKLDNSKLLINNFNLNKYFILLNNFREIRLNTILDNLN